MDKQIYSFYDILAKQIYSFDEISATKKRCSTAQRVHSNHKPQRNNNFHKIHVNGHAKVSKSLSVGKVRLRKQALATDRQLSGVKNGNKYSAAEKALKYWGVEKIKGGGTILEEGEREKHNPKAILPVYASHPSVSPPSLAKNTWHIRSSN